jgi:hypothetical protein
MHMLFTTAPDEGMRSLAKLANHRVQHRLLDTLRGLLPIGVCPITVADIDFWTPFYRYVDILGWHWLGRIRNRDSVALQRLRRCGCRPTPSIHKPQPHRAV